MQSKIKQITEDGKKLYLVQPNTFLDLYFNEKRLVKAYNRKIGKWYKGKNVDVFTTDYDLFNKYYRQAFNDLREYRSDSRNSLRDRLADMRFEKAKPSQQITAEPNGYTCVVKNRPYIRTASLQDARKKAVYLIRNRQADMVEIWRGQKYIGYVYRNMNGYMYRTDDRMIVLKQDGSIF